MSRKKKKLLNLNVLDPKLKFQKNGQQFLIIEMMNVIFFINSLNNKDNIEYNEISEIWKNFSLDTGVEILIYN